MEPNYNFRPSPVPVNNTVNPDTTQMLLTYLNENREEVKAQQQCKNLLANVANFDSKDKQACLMWLNHVEHMAQQAHMTLKEALSAKAGPTELTAISRYPNASNAEVKRVILECFSNIGTKTEANHYLQRMRLDDNSALMTHNAEYAAVHAIACGISPEEETEQQVLKFYANTLDSFTASKLNRKIFKRNPEEH